MLASKKNTGSHLEGRIIEHGGLMQQDTDGKVEFLRHKTTNEPDGGIDSVYKVASNFDYFAYLRNLKGNMKKEVEETAEATTAITDTTDTTDTTKMTKNKWTRVISQDKDLSGKLSKASVNNAVSKFEEIQLGLREPSDCPLAGFELNGGEGMTRGAKETWDKFTSRCKAKGLDCEYNSNADLDKILNNLNLNVHGIPIAAFL